MGFCCYAFKLGSHVDGGGRLAVGGVGGGHLAFGGVVAVQQPLSVGAAARPRDSRHFEVKHDDCHGAGDVVEAEVHFFSA